jgi:predicted HicB family RNase H-like nuclease
MKKEKVILIRVPDDVHKKIKMMCADKQITMTGWVSSLINQYLK